MNPGIFLIQDNEELVEMNEQPYDSERLLQKWLAKYPELLVGNQIDTKEPRRFLLIEQECRVPSDEGGAGRWAIDHLFLDQDAIPTVVEVKRSSDTRVRREVVGQMLDYAANATAHWPVSHIRERFAANCQKRAIDPEEELRAFIGDEIEPEEFWQKVNRNLQERRIRLLFVADMIPTELQRIVEFLNEQMDKTEVLAIEIKQFVGYGHRGLGPRLIGQTTEAQHKKSGMRSERQWHEASLLQDLQEKRGNAIADVVKRLIEWSEANDLKIVWGKGANDGSFAPYLHYGSTYPFIPFRVYTYGNAEILFKRMRLRENLPFNDDDKRLELLRRLNKISGVGLAEDGINRRPSIPLAALVKPQSYQMFVNTIEWAIQRVLTADRSASGSGGSSR